MHLIASPVQRDAPGGYLLTLKEREIPDLLPELT